MFGFKVSTVQLKNMGGGGLVFAEFCLKRLLSDLGAEGPHMPGPMFTSRPAALVRRDALQHKHISCQGTHLEGGWPTRELRSLDRREPRRASGLLTWLELFGLLTLD